MTIRQIQSGSDAQISRFEVFRILGQILCPEPAWVYCKSSPPLERVQVELLGQFDNRDAPDAASDNPELVPDEAAELEPTAAALGILIVVSVTSGSALAERWIGGRFVGGVMLTIHTKNGDDGVYLLV